jgi:DNA-directed RNA polymerase specialized sigma24 family protein
VPSNSPSPAEIGIDISSRPPRLPAGDRPPQRPHRSRRRRIPAGGLCLLHRQVRSNARRPAARLAHPDLKRQCWRQRREAHLDRNYGQEAAESGREELGSFLEALSSLEPDPADRVIEREEGRRRLRRLKPDERTALGMLAAGLSYKEIGELRGWTHTKVNRCLSEGRTALRQMQRVG